jgi:hypothetical protein
VFCQMLLIALPPSFNPGSLESLKSHWRKGCCATHASQDPCARLLVRSDPDLATPFHPRQPQIAIALYAAYGEAVDLGEVRLFGKSFEDVDGPTTLA